MFEPLQSILLILRSPTVRRSGRRGVSKDYVASGASKLFEPLQSIPLILRRPAVRRSGRRGVSKDYLASGAR